MIQKTLELIKILHEGQFDKTGDPYWMHPVDVMNHLRQEATDEDRLIALLHDVPEDCSGDDWEKGKKLIETYSDYVQRGVFLLTRINGQYLHHKTMKITSGTYMDYVRNIIASEHRGAIMTKYSDNQRNSNPERLARISDPNEKAKMIDMAANRYARSIAILEPVFESWK